MSVSLGEEWGLLQKCSRFIADNLSWKTPLTSGTERSLSNDQKFTEYEIKKASLFPYHLATSYLDGSRTCCNILNTLLRFFPHRVGLLVIKMRYSALSNC